MRLAKFLTGGEKNKIKSLRGLAALGGSPSLGLWATRGKRPHCAPALLEGVKPPLLEASGSWPLPVLLLLLSSAVIVIGGLSARLLIALTFA